MCISSSKNWFCAFIPLVSRYEIQGFPREVSRNVVHVPIDAQKTFQINANASHTEGNTHANFVFCDILWFLNSRNLRFVAFRSRGVARCVEQGVPLEKQVSGIRKTMPRRRTTHCYLDFATPLEWESFFKHQCCVLAFLKPVSAISLERCCKNCGARFSFEGNVVCEGVFGVSPWK